MYICLEISSATLHHPTFGVPLSVPTVCKQARREEQRSVNLPLLSTASWYAEAYTRICKEPLLDPDSSLVTGFNAMWQTGTFSAFTNSI